MAKSRPKRTSINGVRNVQTVQGKEPGFVYRWVNDSGDRIKMMEDFGYEIVKDNNVKVGDRRVASPTADGSAVMISGGGGVNQYLMRIPEEFYTEDQQAKAEQINKLEASMKAEAKEQGMYGKIELS